MRVAPEVLCGHVERGPEDAQLVIVSKRIVIFAMTERYRGVLALVNGDGALAEWLPALESYSERKPYALRKDGDPALSDRCLHLTKRYSFSCRCSCVGANRDNRATEPLLCLH